MENYVQIKQYPNLDGFRGTQRTVNEMHKLVSKGRADPTVISVAEQLARRVHKNDYEGQARELFKFVKKWVHYVRDPRGVELLRSPLMTLYNRAGDCDDQAVLFSSLAQAIGFETRFKTVKAKPEMPHEFSHIYSQVFIPGKAWMTADTIVEYAELGWETPRSFESKVWKGGRPSLENYDYREIPSSVPGLSGVSDPSSLSGWSIKWPTHVLGIPVPQPKQIVDWPPTHILGVELSNPKTRRIYCQRYVNRALKQVWDSHGIKWVLELNHIVEDFLDALSTGHQAPSVVGPAKPFPSPTDAVLLAVQAIKARAEGLGQTMAEKAAAAEKATWKTIGDAALIGAFPLFGTIILGLQALGNAKNISYAAECIEARAKPWFPPDGQKYIDFMATVNSVSEAFDAAGGRIPFADEEASENYILQYTMAVKQKIGEEPRSGWMLTYMEALLSDFQRQLPDLVRARVLLDTSYSAYMQTIGQQLIGASAGLVRKAYNAGLISVREIQEGVRIATKVAQGFPLTPEEIALATRLKEAVEGVKSMGWLLPVAAGVGLAVKFLI